MLNILVPMAGAGSRFAKAGFTTPKPLIPINGVPMIRLVIENLRPKSIEHHFIFVAQAAHVAEHHLPELLTSWAPGSSIVSVNELTDGAARTALAARALVNNDDRLMIANSDQYVDIDIEEYLSSQSEDSAGLIMTMTANDPKWSYVRLGTQGDVTEVVEKVVVSDQATVGIYNFNRGADFVWAAENMIAADRKSGGEFYVAPVYNEMIARGDKVATYSIGSENDGMFGLGIPSDLEKFAHTRVSKRAIGRLR